MDNDADHRAALHAGRVWRRIETKERRRWSEWTVDIGPPLLKARLQAKADAGVEQPISGGYSDAMSKLLDEYGLRSIREKTRRDLLHVMENLEAVERWRALQDHPDDLNSPSYVWERFQKSSAQQDKRDAERKPSLVEQALMARVAELEAQLQAARVAAHEMIKGLRAEIEQLKLRSTATHGGRKKAARKY